MSRFRLVLVAAAIIAIAGVSFATACEKSCAGKASTEKASTEKASASSCTAAEKAACASKASTKNASAGACASKATAETASAGASCSSKSATASNASTGACTAAEKAACASKANANCSTAEKAACASGSAKMASAETSYLCAKSRSDLAQMAPLSFLNEAKADEVNVGIQSTEKGFTFVFAGTNQANVEKAVALANNSGDSLGKPAACAYTRADMVESAGGCKTTEACVNALANCDVTVVKTDDGANTVITADSDEKVAEIHTWLVSMGYGAAEKNDSE